MNDYPGLFIFLIDQSGSMKGDSIKLVKESLLLFIQSIPPGSYFQLIGFGSSYKKYNEEPVEYNKENVNEIKNIINRLEADMGGTNISGPLDNIYKNENYNEINLSKNIFLLTDGRVINREECLNLITLNSNKFRIHAIGIGKNFDKQLIEQSGKLGKGSSTYVENIEKINSAVINTLNISLRPYLIDVQFNFTDHQNNIDNNIIKCKPINNFTYQDEIMNYSFILKETNNINLTSQPINIEIKAKDPKNDIKENIILKNGYNIIKIKDGDEIGKMIVGKALKNNKELKNDVNKEVEFSKKYQILSKNTSFFAEILNDIENKNKLIEVKINKSSYSRERFRGLIYSRKSSRGLSNSRKRFRDWGNSRETFQDLSYSRETSQYLSYSRERFRDLCSVEPDFSKCYSISKYKKSTFPSNMILNNIGKLLILALVVGLIALLGPKKSFVLLGIIGVCLAIYLIIYKYFFNENVDTNKVLKRQKMEKEECANKNDNNKNNDELIKLIMSQDILEGFWNQNKETKNLEKNIPKDVYDKITNKIKALNKGLEEETKIIYTSLVIYFLNSNLRDKLNDYKLIINKGKKYLISQGLKYEDIIV